MKVYSFFRLLNIKIKQYEESVSNIYEPIKRQITIIWVEDAEEKVDRSGLA